MTRPTFMHRAGTGFLVASLLALAVACGDDDDETGTQGQAAATTAAPAATAAPATTAATATSTTAGSASITIQNFTFMGIDNAAAGVPFRIENKDQVPHTVSSVDGKFPVWRVEPGETKTFGSLAAGSYAIRCDVHPSRMTGTLVVA